MRRGLEGGSGGGVLLVPDNHRKDYKNLFLSVSEDLLRINSEPKCASKNQDTFRNRVKDVETKPMSIKQGNQETKARIIII